MHVPPGNAMLYRTRSANANALKYFDAFALYQLAAHQLNREHPKFAKSPQARSLGLILRSPSGFASLGDGNRHPQLDSPPAWANKPHSPRRWALFL